MRVCRASLICCALVLSHAPSSLLGSGDVPVPKGPELAIKPPLPVWPSDYETITERKPVFRLNGRFGATSYRVELARDADFTQPVVLTQFRVVEEKGITPVVEAPFTGDPLTDGQYYWRGFCKGPDNTETPPANCRTFFVSKQDVDAIAVPDNLKHPWLLPVRQNLDRLKDRMGSPDPLGRGIRYQINAAYSLLDAPPLKESYAKAGVGQHGNYSLAAAWYHRHLGTLAFASHLTDDPRLIQKATELLLTASAYERWLGEDFENPEKFNPPWHAALETAMMTRAVAVGYDLLYAHLTPEQRETVRRALTENGIRRLVRDWADPVTAARLPRHQIPTGNWVMVCTASAGIGALAMLNEHPEAPHWVRLCRNRVRAWLKDRGGDYYVDQPWPAGRPDPIPVIGPSDPNFDADGGYKESLSYMNYAMNYVVGFADPLQRNQIDNLFTHIPANILNHLVWSANAWRADNEVFSRTVEFGDCWGPTDYYADLCLTLSEHRGDRLAAWLYRRIIPVPASPQAVLWHNETAVEQPPEAPLPMAVFRGIGQVIMRTGWSPETPMAAIKFHQNRGHLDLGTFHIFGAGRPLIIDSGPSSYGGPLYGKYSAQSIGHNVVLVDNRSQERTDGRLVAAVATGALAATSGDLTAAYPSLLQSWSRDLLLLPGGLAVVLDQLRSNAPRQMDLLLHPEPSCRRSKVNQLLIGQAPAQTVVEIRASRPFLPVQESGYYLTLPRDFFRFRSVQPQKEQDFFTAIALPDLQRHESARPQVLEDAPGVWRLDDPPQEPTLGLRVGGSTTGWFQTDARIAAVWRPGRRTGGLHAVMLAGSRLLVDEVEILRSTGPTHVALELATSARLSFWNPADIRVSLRLPRLMTGVFLDGKTIQNERDRDAVRIDVPAGEHEVFFSDFGRYVPRTAPLRVDDLLAMPSSDSPAYRPEVIAQASSFWSPPIDAIDGNAHSAWASLPGLPMPQWMEVQLPVAEKINQVTIAASLPCAGRLQIWDRKTDSPRPDVQFVVMANQRSTVVDVEPVEMDRIRLVVDLIDPVNNSARIDSLTWTFNERVARP